MLTPGDLIIAASPSRPPITSSSTIVRKLFKRTLEMRVEDDLAPLTLSVLWSTDLRIARMVR